MPVQAHGGRGGEIIAAVRSQSQSVKQTAREADQSPPSSAEVEYVWSHAVTPPYGYMGQG